jgi:WD40 repeat protein
MFSLFSALSAQETEYLLHTFNDHKAPVLSVALSPDGKFLATGGEDKLLMVYDLATYAPVWAYAENYFAPRALVMTQTNNLFMGSGPDVKLIDMQNNTLGVYKGNSTHIWSVAYAPERNKVASGSYDYKLRVWDASTQELELILEGHKKSTLPVAFSPDEKYLVSGSLDRTVKVWNAKTGELIRSLEKHSENIYDIAFHPSGKYFASASRDKTIRLWDFESGEVLVTFSGHDQGVTDIEFLPDGNHLLSASYDGSMRLWQSKTGKMVYTFAEHTGPVNSIDVSADGKIFASGGVDRKVLLWELIPKIYVEYSFYDEFNTEKESISLFDERRKGEKKEDFEQRSRKAAEKEGEIVNRYYQLYLENLKKMDFKK